MQMSRSHRTRAHRQSSLCNPMYTSSCQATLQLSRTSSMMQQRNNTETCEATFGWPESQSHAVRIDTLSSNVGLPQSHMHIALTHTSHIVTCTRTESHSHTHRVTCTRIDMLSSSHMHTHTRTRTRLQQTYKLVLRHAPAHRNNMLKGGSASKSKTTVSSELQLHNSSRADTPGMVSQVRKCRFRSVVKS